MSIRQKISLGAVGVVLYIAYSLFMVPNFANAVSYTLCQNVPECSLDRNTLSATPWFSIPGSSFHNVGGLFQYNPADANPTVTAVFRGSYFYNNPNRRQIDVYSTNLGCNVKGVYCNNINASGGSVGGGGRGVFASINTADYFRGTSARTPNIFTNSGTGYDRESKIDLNSVAGFSRNSTGIQDLRVPVYSRLRWSGDVSGYGSGDWTIIPIRVQARPSWTLSPSTAVNNTTAKPGETITWTHTVRNSGPSSTGRNASAAGGANENGVDTTYTQAPWIIASGFTSGSTSQKTSTYIPKASDVGSSVCRGTTVSNYSESSTGWTGWSDSKCVYVPYDFNLVPNITPIGDVLEPGSGQKIPITGNISNNGKTTSRADGNWQLSQIIFSGSPTATQKSGGDNSDEACAWTLFNPGKKSCTKVATGNWTDKIDIGSIYKDGISSELLAEDYPVGTTVCYTLAVKPFREDSTGWRHSALECVTFGKKPKVQVWGGDLMAGRNMPGSVASTTASSIQTSLSVKTIKRTESREIVEKKDITAGGPASGNDISGLWRTGVNASNQKAGPNESDAHWYIRSVFNDGPAKSATCAKGYTLSGGTLVGPVRTNNYTPGNTPPFGISNWQAVTVVDANVWGNNPTNARWVGLNQTGRDYPNRFTGDVAGDCSAPARNGVLTNANTHVYRLRQPIKISPEVLIDSNFKLTMKGAADNVMKVFVNGCEMKAAPGARMSSFQTNWLDPGWTVNSEASVVAQAVGACSSGARGFKHGDNTLEVYVRSDWTYTGLLVKDFSVGGKKEIKRTEVVTVEDKKAFGSWGEFALVANGQIKNMASGAAFLPNGSDSTDQDTWSRITFANTFKVPRPAGITCTSAEKWGCYKYTNSNMPDVGALFSSGTNLAAGTVSTSVGDLTKNTTHRKTSGTVNLDGGALNRSQWVVLNATGATVNITSNINYTNVGLANTREIPQMVIIADNINIRPGVTNIDSWLIAKNSLATCDEAGGAVNLNASSSAFRLSSAMCSNELRVNGPVMAKKLWLRRTAGAGTGDNTGDPAEIFNYRPDAMIWLNNQLSSQSLRTTSIKELPPRF